MKTSILTKLTIGICLAMLIIPSNLSAQIKVPSITGIKDFDFNIACELIIKQGDQPSINITGDEDATSEIYFRTSGDKLIVKTYKRHQHKEDVKITLIVPNINELSLSGVVDLTTPNELNFDNFKMDVSGVADIDLNLKSQKFTLDASGILKGEIVGETKDMKLDISGMGKLDASNFKSYSCEVEISGMGNADVNVSENLDASVSGMGKVAYAGNPKVYANTSGIGRIRRL